MSYQEFCFTVVPEIKYAVSEIRDSILYIVHLPFSKTTSHPLCTWGSHQAADASVLPPWLFFFLWKDGSGKQKRKSELHFSESTSHKLIQQLCI